MEPAISTPMTSKRGAHWAQINEFSFVAGMRLLYWVARIFGRWPLRFALYPIALWYLFAKPTARAASRAYLGRIARVNPTLKVRPGLLGVLRHFVSFGESIFDKMLLWSGSFDANSIKFHGLEIIIEQIAARRGGILICAHLGNLELCRVLAQREPGLSLTVLLHTLHAVRFNRLLAQLNPASGVNLMQVTELTSATAVLLADKVARGEFVAIAGDRIPVTANGRVASAKFVGDTARFPVGPYVLANLFRCPIYLLFSLRAERGWEIHFEPFRDSIELPRHGRDNALAALVADYAARLEDFCQRAPLEWFNFYDFWYAPSMQQADAP
jgi:predicted LPLAT superfamily acyltransferase